jgi:Flp pilus assembly secretin CpaC
MQAINKKRWVWIVLISAFTAGFLPAQTDADEKPVRLYINISESEKVTFPQAADEVTASVRGVVRVVQPTPNVLLLEAMSLGKTTVTVSTGGQIKRFFVTTFENRGADVLNIQNSFTAKGYNLLQVGFDTSLRDQIILSGIVGTQEELDDAVAIVKKYTPFVVVRATVGQMEVRDGFSEHETVIVNNIIRIAGVPGLRVKVKFPAPTETVTSSTSRFTGDRFQNVSETNSDVAGRTTTSRIEFPGQAAPAAGSQAGGPGATEVAPLQNTQETVTRTENRSLPEKIFLFGEVEDDLLRTRAIRVARTFCPLVVSFITVKDPIQLKIDLAILQVDMGKLQDYGVRWSSASGNGPFAIGAGMTYNASGSNDGIRLTGAPLTELLTYSLSADASATMRFLEQNNLGRRIQQPSLFVANGQSGQFFVGDVIPFVTGFTTIQNGVNNQVIPTIERIPIGVGVGIFPMNYENSSNRQGTFDTITGGANDEALAVDAGQYDFQQLRNPIGTQPRIPEVDMEQKYVDESGIIGLRIYSNLSSITGSNEVAENINVPTTSTRSLITRVFLKDGESVTVAGLIDDNTQRNVTKFPMLAEIPIFGWLFKNPTVSRDKQEIIFVYTPHIIRQKDTTAKKVGKPKYLEMENFVQDQLNLDRSIKPVRYNMAEIDLRPDMLPVRREGDGKTMEGATISAPLQPAADAPQLPQLPGGEVQDQSNVIQDTPDAPPAPAPDEMPVEENAPQPAVDTAPPATDTAPEVEETNPPTLP